MAINHATLTQALMDAFPGSTIECKDLAGDEDHWHVSIGSTAFLGQSRIMQHKMVQQALTAYTIHALSIKTYVPQS